MHLVLFSVNALLLKLIYGNKKMTLLKKADKHDKKTPVITVKT